MSSRPLSVEKPGRTAVLHDINHEHTPAVGCAVEFPDRVDVALPSGYCFPRYYREPITVGCLALDEPPTYSPGDPEYFDQVLQDLSRSFAIGQQNAGPTDKEKQDGR